MEGQYSVLPGQPIEEGDPSKYQKRDMKDAKNYSAATLFILIGIIVLALIGFIFMIAYHYPRLSDTCDDGNPTTNDYRFMGGCVNMFAGIDAVCSDVCLLEEEGAVQLDPMSGEAVCNGVSRGQCDTMFLAPDVDCPDIQWVPLVDSAGIENITFCAFGRCVYTLHIGLHGDDSIIDTLSWIMNTDTMAEKLNALCLDFVDDADPQDRKSVV